MRNFIIVLLLSCSFNLTSHAQTNGASEDNTTGPGNHVDIESLDIDRNIPMMILNKGSLQEYGYMKKDEGGRAFAKFNVTRTLRTPKKVSISFNYYYQEHVCYAADVGECTSSGIASNLDTKTLILDFSRAKKLVGKESEIFEISLNQECTFCRSIDPLAVVIKSAASYRISESANFWTAGNPKIKFIKD